VSACCGVNLMNARKAEEQALTEVSAKLIGRVVGGLIAIGLTSTLLVYVWLNAHWAVALAITMERIGACVEAISRKRA